MRDIIPDRPSGRALDGSWQESVCSGNPLVRAPLGGSSEDWDWAGTSPVGRGPHRGNTALCYTYTHTHTEKSH